MRPLRVLSGSDVCKILEANGFEFVRQAALCASLFASQPCRVSYLRLTEPRF